MLGLGQYLHKRSCAKTFGRMAVTKRALMADIDVKSIDELEAVRGSSVDVFRFRTERS